MRWPLLLISPMRSRWSRPRVVRSMIFARSNSANAPSNSQRQLVLGIVDVVLAADDDLLAILEQLADHYGLVCDFAAMRSAQRKLDRVEHSCFHVCAHFIESGSIQLRAAVAVVDVFFREDMTAAAICRFSSAIGFR